MHLFKHVIISQDVDTSSLLKAEECDNRGFQDKSGVVTIPTRRTGTSSPSGVIGGGGDALRGWSGARSYRPSTRSSSGRFADSNKLLSIFTVIGLILIFSNFTKMSGVSAMPRCPPSGTGVENEDPVDCSYGITVDYCGRKVCAKGPGQICGVGLFKLLGSCGEGLYCNCGRCTGCSLLTMECYDKTCV